VIAIAVVTIAAILPAGGSRHSRASAAPPGLQPRAGSTVPGASLPTTPARRISSSAGPQPSSLPAPSTTPSMWQAVAPAGPQPSSLLAPSATPSAGQAVVPVASPPPGTDGDGDGGSGDG
jgi:hypothetical protein